MQRKSHESRYCLDGAERPEAALLGALPDPLELVAKRLPLVKLPLPDLTPTLETAHVCPPYEITTTAVVIIVRSNKACQYPPILIKALSESSRVCARTPQETKAFSDQNRYALRAQSGTDL